MITLRLMAFATALMLAGCTPPPPLTPLNTPSGKPEVHINGKTQQEIIEGVINACSEKGSMIDSQTVSMVVCSKGVTDLGLSLRFGTKYGALMVKNQFFVTKEGQGYRLQLVNSWVENMNAYGGVQRTPIEITKGPNAQDIQKRMELIARQIDGKE